MNRLAVVFFSVLFIFFITNAQAKSVKVLLITGGHSYDTVQFFAMFDSMKGIKYKHFQQPDANRSLVTHLADGYDVVAFYDMWKTISEPEKMAYIELTKSGKPFLFLHHSLASYPDWAEFEKILGGKYFEKKPGVPKEKLSTYQHDVWVDVEVLPGHRITNSIKNFRIFDEVYGNFRVIDGVVPLLKTNHPQSSPIIGWENRYNQSRVVYLQSGHDKNGYSNPHFKQLIKASIKYLSKKDKP
jgi:hypothetical protein